MHRSGRFFRRLALIAAALAGALHAQTVALDALTVTSTRAPEPAAQVPFSVVSFSGDFFRESPSTTVDGALRAALPGFSLFRRSDSLIANPTAQGLSLRGLGPSGASRSLILLDGVPLNDPFGGWVPWALVPRDSLVAAEVVRGGGATAWGNAALGGVLQLLTAPPAAAVNRVEAGLGDFKTYTGEFSAKATGAHGTLQVLGGAFSTDGVPLVAPEVRGPIDIDASSRHEWLAARWEHAVGANSDLIVSVRTFDEHRNNGTPYTENSSQLDQASAVWQARVSDAFHWEASAYAQDQKFSSTFSSVNALRTAETPASDQFDVPATAAGLAWSGLWIEADGSRTTFGADARTVRGETRENFSYANGSYTRQRRAGGAQDFAGVFVLEERALAPDWRATAGARLDYWDERDGHRRETDRATGNVLRDDHDPRLDGSAFNPSAGLIWQAAAAWRVRASAEQSFRRPTLNELYRPFRAGSVVTEANPALHTEHARTAEIAVEYSRKEYGASLTAFTTDLRDAVGNVTLARGPGTFPLFGTLGAGAVGRQRQNLDRIRVRGLEFAAHADPVPALRLSVDGLLADDRVTRAPNAPNLVGLQLAQAPRRVFSAGATWQAPRKFSFTARVHWAGAQFEDDENTLRLAPATTVDLGATHALGTHGEIFLSIENLFSVRVETGRSADGTVNVAPPRFARGGMRWKW